MKKVILSALLLFLMLPSLSACGTDYNSYVSEVRSDLFCAETEEFTVTLSCVSREQPYVTDGVACQMTNLVEIVLVADSPADEYCVYVLGDKEWGGDMSFRNVRGDYFYSQTVEAFPESSVSLRVEWGEEKREITATSVRNEKTITPEEALSYAIAAERQLVDGMTQGSDFMGEFYVRLLRRDKNYYYVGITDKNGKTVSLLLDGESGEVLAKRITE